MKLRLAMTGSGLLAALGCASAPAALSIGIPVNAASPQAQTGWNQPLRSGVFVRSELTTSHPVEGKSYHQHYVYNGIAGHRVWVNASSPQRFQVAVAIYPPGKGVRPLADDGGRASRDDWTNEPTWEANLAATLPATDQYTICVHSHQDMTFGPYELVLSSARTN